MRFLKFGKNKGIHGYIHAHINIHTILFEEIINEDYDITLPPGTTVKKMLKISVKEEYINRSTYRCIKKLTHPFAVSINGEVNADNPNRKIYEGDRIFIFTPVSGG